MTIPRVDYKRRHTALETGGPHTSNNTHNDINPQDSPYGLSTVQWEVLMPRVEGVPGQAPENMHRLSK